MAEEVDETSKIELLGKPSSAAQPVCSSHGDGGIPSSFLLTFQGVLAKELKKDSKEQLEAMTDNKIIRPLCLPGTEQ